MKTVREEGDRRSVGDAPLGLSRESVLCALSENTLFYNPIVELVVDPYWEGYDDRELILRDLPLETLKDLVGKNPGAYLDELIEGQAVDSSVPLENREAVNDVISRIADEAGWIQVGMPYDKLIAACEGVLAERGVQPAGADRWTPSKPTRTPPPAAIADYLSAALDEYRTKSGWRALDAETAIETFCHFISSGECSVSAPVADELRMSTPDGDLVAYAQDLGDYRSIVIDLERSDGNSGQVCMAEWVAEGARGPAMEFSRGADGRTVASVGDEPIYPTPFHTFAYDGDMDDPAAAVDLNPTGAEMWYSPRALERNECLDAQAASVLGARDGKVIDTASRGELER